MNRQLHQRTNRRRFVQGAAAGAAMVGASWLPTRTDRIRAMQDTFDWKQFDGSQVRLILNKHPYTESLLPLFPEFTELTGIAVPEPLILPEAEYFQKLLLDLSTGAGEFDAFMTGPYVTGHMTAPAGPSRSNRSSTITNMTSPDYDAADIFEGLMAANRWDLTLGGGVGQGKPVGDPGHGRDLCPVATARTCTTSAGIEPAVTIEQWRANNAKATSGDVKGIIVRGERGGGMTGTGFISTFRGYGGVVFDEDLVCQINSPEGVHVAESTAPRCASPGLRAGQT